VIAIDPVTVTRHDATQRCRDVHQFQRSTVPSVSVSLPLNRTLALAASRVYLEGTTSQERWSKRNVQWIMASGGCTMGGGCSLSFAS